MYACMHPRSSLETERCCNDYGETVTNASHDVLRPIQKAEYKVSLLIYGSHQLSTNRCVPTVHFDYSLYRVNETASRVCISTNIRVHTTTVMEKKKR